MKRLTFILLSITISMMISPASGTVYVSTTGSDASDGSSWTSAKLTIQGGIDAAALKPGGDEVNVACGVYYEMIALKQNVQLRGGFLGSGAQRAQVGAKAYSIPHIQGAQLETIIDAQGKGTTVVISSVGSALIDGFTIRGSSGAGISCTDSAAAISNNLVTQNPGTGVSIFNTPPNDPYTAPTPPAPDIIGNAIIGNGAGISVFYAAANIRDNVIIQNAGGISCNGPGVQQPSPWQKAIIHGNNICRNSNDGIWISYSSAEIAGNTISYNSGRGIYCTPGGIELTDNTIQGNGNCGVYSGNYLQGARSIVSNTIIDNSGPGIHCDYRSPGNISNNLISRNAGNGIYGNGSSPSIESNTITANKAGGIACLGNAAHFSSPGIRWNIITGNVGSGISCADSQNSEGGRLYVTGNAVSGNTAINGGGIICTSNLDGNFGPPIISGNELTGNIADYGGGIYCSTTTASTTENDIIDNKARIDGGGIYCTSATAAFISANIISANTAASFGGGVACDGNSSVVANNLIIKNSAAYGGGVAALKSSAAQIVNNTLVENRADIRGGAVFYDATSNPTMVNLIVAGNRSAEGGSIGSGSSGGTVIASCFWDMGDAPFYPSGSSPIGQNGNIEVDPQFLAPWVGEYHLRPTSPCINTGDNIFAKAEWADLDGRPRILPNVVDMGCFEWDQSPYWVRRVSQARAVPEGFAIELRDKRVTAVFADAAYVEDSNRSGGLRVIASTSANPGDLLTMSGQMTLDTVERALSAASVQVNTSEAFLNPLGMPNRFVGGGDYFYSSSPEPRGQKGISGAYGLNNTGILISTWGRVVAAAPDGTWFRISDGSLSTGLKVILPQGASVPATGSFLRVTGISSCEQAGENIRPLLRVRNAGDIAGI